MSKSIRILLATSLLVALTGPAQAEEPAPRWSPLFRLMPAAKDRQYRAYLPKIEGDPQVERMLQDPRLILYTEAEMPRAYQFWDNQLQGIHSAYYNISANGSEPYGNGNIEFPWGTPAGTHRSRYVRSFRFLWLPYDHQGRYYPIVWYRKQLSGDSSMGYAWTFPIGTVVGEVLQQRAYDGKYYTFEMRLRMREADDWAVDVFRPFPTAEHLARRIRELRPSFADDPELTRLVEHLEQPRRLPNMTLADYHPRRTFHQRMGVDSLPPIDDRLAIELLTTTPFRSALGETWRFGADGNYTFAPTTSDTFHVVPQNYDAGFISVDRHSCVRCHETVNQHVNRFQSGRDWYGRIRGSDGIFSFHPFDPSSIAGNGIGRGVAMRRELIEAGILAPFDQQRHTSRVYRRISHLRE
mgnify:CR=1 FL=1